MQIAQLQHQSICTSSSRIHNPKWHSLLIPPPKHSEFLILPKRYYLTPRTKRNKFPRSVHQFAHCSAKLFFHILTIPKKLLETEEFHSMALMMLDKKVLLLHNSLHIDFFPTHMLRPNRESARFHHSAEINPTLWAG